MHWFKRLAEWYLGIPPADPGQGTNWNVNFREPWPEWIPAWAVLVLAVLLVGFVVAVYWRDSRSLSVWRRWVLISLRLATIAVLLVILCQLTLAVDRTGLPFVALLIDDSASMGFEDQYSDRQEQAKAYSAAGGRDGATRLNLAKSLLAGQDGLFVKQLLRRHKLRLYRFSDTAVRMGKPEYVREGDVSELSALIESLSADGDQTRPGPAVEKVLDDFRGTPPSAVVVLTDGITTTSDAEKLTVAAEVAKRKLVPIYTIGLGSEEPAKDLQLYDTLVDEVAFVDDPITFSTKIKAYGYKGRKVVVTLTESGSKTALASSKPLPIAADGQSVKAEIEFTPTREGEFEFALQAQPLPNETNPENNSETRHVSVRAGRIRVLLVESTPRWEFRQLKFLLERERTVELHTVLLDADLEFADQDATAKLLRGRFPVKRDSLYANDVVILGDVDPKALTPAILDNLRDFVAEAGGGLILIAGETNNPVKYRETVLENMLPIELAGAQPPPLDLPQTNGFRPRLTPAGQKGTTIFRFADGERESLAIWNGLAELYWLFPAFELKPGAVVFAEHPTRTGSSGNLPVICMHRFGKGKVLFHATDELWRWRMNVADKYYGRYWVQTIRYLSRSRLLGQTRTAELTADRLVYNLGDAVKLRLRFLDEQHVPPETDGVTVMVESRGDAGRPVTLTRLRDALAVFEGEYRRAPQGTYHAWVASPSFKETPPSVDFRVQAPQVELETRSLDRAELTKTAKATHGKFYTIADAAQLPDDLPPGQPVPLESEDPVLLWNRWEVLLLFASLLLAEWLLRRRSRLI